MLAGPPERDTAIFPRRSRILWLCVDLPHRACFPDARAVLGAQTAKTYKTRLSPVPVPAYTPTVVGSGTVTGTLTGTKLEIAGTFDGLNTPATVARVHKSPKPGMRGPALFELTVTKARAAVSMETST